MTMFVASASQYSRFESTRRRIRPQGFDTSLVQWRGAGGFPQPDRSSACDSRDVRRAVVRHGLSESYPSHYLPVFLETDARDCSTADYHMSEERACQTARPHAPTCKKHDVRNQGGQETKADRSRLDWYSPSKSNMHHPRLTDQPETRIGKSPLVHQASCRPDLNANRKLGRRSSLVEHLSLRGIVCHKRGMYGYTYRASKISFSVPSPRTLPTLRGRFRSLNYSMNIALGGA
jgi:hypothetical protein